MLGAQPGPAQSCAVVASVRPRPKPRASGFVHGRGADASEGPPKFLNGKSEALHREYPVRLAAQNKCRTCLAFGRGLCDKHVSCSCCARQFARAALDSNPPVVAGFFVPETRHEPR